MKATFQKAFEMFYEQTKHFMELEGSGTWSGKMLFSVAVICLREAGFFKHLSKSEIETVLKEIGKE